MQHVTENIPSVSQDFLTRFPKALAKRFENSFWQKIAGRFLELIASCSKQSSQSQKLIFYTRRIRAFVLCVVYREILQNHIIHAIQNNSINCPPENKVLNLVKNLYRVAVLYNLYCITLRYNCNL